MTRLRLPSWLLAATLLCLHLGPSASARGEEPSRAVGTEAKEWIRRALELRRQERNAEALEAFRRAHELRPSPTTEAQIGITLASLGDFIGAEKHLLQALANAEHAFIRKNQPILRETLERVRAQLATLELTGGPEGAELLINERRAGTLPLGKPLRVLRGRVVVEVRAHGYLPYTRVLDLNGQERATLQLTLQKLDSPMPQALRAAHAEAGPSSRSVRKIAGYTVLGASGLMVAMGIIGLAVSEERVRTFNDACQGRQGEPDCVAINDEYRLARNIGIAGFAVGGALGLTGAAVLLWPKLRRRASASLPAPARTALQHLDCTPLAGAGAMRVSCRLRF